MKKLSLFLFLLMLTLSAVIACQEKTDNGNDGSTQETTTAAIEATTASETEAPVILAGADGTVISDTALHGWFDYGSALYMRDEFKVGLRESLTFTMAKNELEGFQYILASTVNYDGLRCEVSALTDENGNTLEGTVFLAQDINVRRSDDIHDRGFYPDAILEQDNPYHGGTFDVRAGRSKTLYVQYLTDENTVPGTYRGRLEIKQGDAVLLSGEVSIKVYNIYYDENTACRSYVEWSPKLEKWEKWDEGIPNIAYDYPELMEAYCDILVENRLSPMHLPYTDLRDERVAKYMDDPRVNTVMIHYTYDNLDYLAEQYRTATEKGWCDKIVFLSYDEPSTEEHFGKLIAGVNLINAHFPSTHHLNAFFTDIPSGGRNLVERFSDFSTAHCIKSSAIDGTPALYQSMLSLKEERDDSLYWYICGPQGGNYINLMPCTPGTSKRVLFWQQYLYHIDGFHYWHTNYWEAYANIWEEGYADKKQKPAGSAVSFTGDGCLVYWDPITYEPIGSLGLEAVRDGIEDFQLMRMAEEILGKDTVMAYVSRITASLTDYTSDSALLEQVKTELAAALEAALAQ